jgi:hypothetical protein
MNNFKETLLEKGTNPVLIDRIIDNADQLKDANVTQETLKETTKEVSDEAVGIFNEIYDEIIGICKIAASFYQYDTLKKERKASRIAKWVAPLSPPQSQGMLLSLHPVQESF